MHVALSAIQPVVSTAEANARRRCVEGVFASTDIVFVNRNRSGKYANGRMKQNQDLARGNLRVAGLSHVHSFIVCDGHGAHGHFVSKHVVDKYDSELLLWIESLRDDHWIMRQHGPLEKEVVEDVYNNLRAIVLRCENALYNELPEHAVLSGTTLNAVLLVGNVLFTVNVGDSRSALVTVENNVGADELLLEGDDDLDDDVPEIIASTPLTVDHDLTGMSEMEAIRRAGGVLSRGERGGPSRVWLATDKAKSYVAHNSPSAKALAAWTCKYLRRHTEQQIEIDGGTHCGLPGLAMSRSIGDFVGKLAGVSAEPDLSHSVLTLTENAHHYIVLGSDGFYGVVDQDILDDMVISWEHRIVSNTGRENTYTTLEKVVDEAIHSVQRTWIVTQSYSDDITALVVRISAR